MQVSIRKLKWNGATWWQRGFAVNYLVNRLKIVHESGNILYDGSVSLFKEEVAKGRMMYD